MRAYVYHADDAGQAIAGTGAITGDYASERTLIRYGVDPIRNGAAFGKDVRVEIFGNWDRRYGKPDKVLLIRLAPALKR